MLFCHLLDVIEQAIAAWTAKMTADDAMATLQHAGVAAGVARPPLELLDDPHLKARHFWQWIERAFVIPGHPASFVGGMTDREQP